MNLWMRAGNQACFAESCSQYVADRLFQLHTLQSENSSLRRQVTANIYQIPSSSDYPDPSSPSALKRRQSSRASRPMSMYETGSGLKPFLSKGETPYQEEGIPTLQPFPPHVSKTRSQLSFAISFPVPFSIPFLLFLCLFHPFLGSGDVIRNISYISSRRLPKLIIPHSSVVYWCRLVVHSCALETMLLF